MPPPPAPAAAPTPPGTDDSGLRLPSIEGLRAFETAARLGTFERAAEALHITASAVSKRVATLEALLGTALLTRSGKALQLTATGREYLQQVAAALGLLAAMPQHQRAAQRVQRLRVVSPPTFAREVLVPRLASFTQAHPQVELELLLSIPFLAIQPGEADVEVCHAAPGLGRPLLQDRVLPLAAPALLQRLPTLRTPADLRHAPLLRTPIEPWAPWFRAAGLNWAEPATGPRLVDLGLVLEAALSGQGVALGRPSLALRWLQQGALRPLFGMSTTPATQYQLQVAAEGPAVAAAQAFADWLAATCAQVEAEAAAALEAFSGRG
jgi:LysR family glycine cleavage system transcriptional activator